MRSLLRECLEDGGYSVIEAATGQQAMELLGDNVDLITLDLKLEGEDGLMLARDIRQVSDVPIVMVTGKGEPIDRVIGLELGADDYIAKPFLPREVIARVRSVLRRTSRPAVVKADESLVYIFGEWTADFEKLEVRSSNGGVSGLSVGQVRLLEILIKNRDKVLSRDRIMDLAKGQDWMPTDRTIDNQISRLRKGLEIDPKNPVYIKTIHGAGYKFTGDVKIFTGGATD